MFFNTLEFVGFLSCIYILFVLTNKDKLLPARNLILLIGSYYFYSNLHVWFVILLIYTTLVNYFGGLWIDRCKAKGSKGRKAVTVTIMLSLAQLIAFKYAYLVYPSVLLPVGLSFFTFQALSYTIELYRGKINVEKNLLTFSLFVSFFPTLLSGPIERARNMLSQFRQTTILSWEYLVQGASLFVWGLFKKIVIADRLAEYVNMTYMQYETQTGSTLALAAVFYSFQIYCDFSGYADMAIGTSRILGFRVMENFRFPYCAHTIKDFWRRWHISLTSWFTEYVYISMGGNRVNRMRWILNISLVFLLSGIWHGVTWSFILWGLIHAVLYLIEHYLNPQKFNWIYSIYIFIMITFAWIFFRVDNCTKAWQIIIRICTDLFSPINWGSSTFSTIITGFLLILFIVREWIAYKQILSKKYMVEYIFLLICIALLGVSGSQFVYFQF